MVACKFKFPKGNTGLEFGTSARSRSGLELELVLLLSSFSSRSHLTGLAEHSDCFTAAQQLSKDGLLHALSGAFGLWLFWNFLRSLRSYEIFFA
ncbi:MAG: hypothetical protein AAFX40_02925 [Cyanobacteria bacterium J06639_1]